MDRDYYALRKYEWLEIAGKKREEKEGVVFVREREIV